MLNCHKIILTIFYFYIDKRCAIAYTIHRMKNHKTTITKIFRLGEVAEIRTGIVVSRLKMANSAKDQVYRLLNLKCMQDRGGLAVEYAEPLEIAERIPDDCLTHIGDVLVRLSAPYTCAAIVNPCQEGYVVPSHFAIVRCGRMLDAGYLCGYLQQDKIKKMILLNNSGSSAFGTIRSSFFAELNIPILPLEQQEIIGRIAMLKQRENDLMQELAKETARYNKLKLTQIYFETIKEK